jgi:hypothetical protein
MPLCPSELVLGNQLWQSSNAIKSVMMDFAPGSSWICIDTGASACISNNENDFVSLVACNNNTIQGIGTGLKIARKGRLQWSIHTNGGQAVNLYVRDNLFVPGVPMNPLSAVNSPTNGHCS